MLSRSGLAQLMPEQIHTSSLADTNTGMSLDAGLGTSKAPAGAFYWLFFVFPGAFLIMDLALTGSGQWSAALGFSVRRLVLVMLAGYALTLWIGASLRGLAGVLGIGLFLLIWSVQIPLFYEVPLAFSLDDSQLFLGLLFAPALAQAVVRSGCWPQALRLIDYSVLMLALLHIGLFAAEKILPGGSADLVLAMRTVLEPSRSEQETNFLVGPLAEGFRVFWGSTIFLLLGLYLAVRNFNRRPFWLSLTILLGIGLAIQLTLTRAMLLSIPLFLFLACFFNLMLGWLRLSTVLYLLIGSALLALTLPTVLLADPTLLAAVGLGREVSDDIRYEQVMALSDGIMATPWFGSGMGAHVDLVRSEASPWMYELSMLALYMKIGLIGVVWLLVTFVVLARAETVDLHHLPISADIRWTLARIAALLFCIFFCGNTNPYLFSMLGWGLLVFAYIEFCFTIEQWRRLRALADRVGH